MNQRASLPDRRQNRTHEIAAYGATWRVCIGYDAHGRAREVFMDGDRVGSEVAHLLSDACVAISVALQHGVPASAMGASCGTVPVFGEDDATAPASALGAVLTVLAIDDADIAAMVRARDADLDQACAFCGPAAFYEADVEGVGMCWHCKACGTPHGAIRPEDVIE